MALCSESLNGLRLVTNEVRQGVFDLSNLEHREQLGFDRLRLNRVLPALRELGHDCEVWLMADVEPRKRIGGILFQRGRQPADLSLEPDPKLGLVKADSE